jgi:hypothetical protein
MRYGINESLFNDIVKNNVSMPRALWLQTKWNLQVQDLILWLYSAVRRPERICHSIVDGDVQYFILNIRLRHLVSLSRSCTYVRTRITRAGTPATIVFLGIE